jgi:(2Fe-2S) ferredoxin
MKVGRAGPPDLVIPERQTENYEELCAWYSGFSFCEHYRKVVQAQCEAIVRAQLTEAGEKVTDRIVEMKARLHPGYLAYLERHLYGRILWERAFLAQGGMR